MLVLLVLLVATGPPVAIAPGPARSGAAPIRSSVTLPPAVPTNATWTRATPPTSPPPRSDENTAYDVAESRLVMFGGEGPAGHVLDDTWFYVAGDWIPLLLLGPHPSARYDASMAYYPENQDVVLFGGLLATPGLTTVGDTWVYAHGTWTNLTSSLSVSPPPRAEESMVYDPIEGCLLLFGGYSSITGGALNDTWEFCGGTWKPVVGPAPPVSEETNMVYDPADGYVLLTESWPRNEFWAFAQGSWHQLFPKSPYPYGLEGMLGYDEGDGFTLFFGGLNGSATYENSTWAYRNGSWTVLTPSRSPPPEAYVQEETPYDEADHDLVLFGGVLANGTVLNTTWTWGAPEYPVSVSVAPPNGGMVRLNYLEYANGATAWLPTGNFSFLAIPAVGYSYVTASVQGALSLAASATLDVGAGGGGLLVRFVGYATLTFVNTACGTITFNGSTLASGSSGQYLPTWPVGPGPPYGATAPGSCSCATFSGWSTSGGLLVASSTSSFTTLNVSGSGTLTARYAVAPCGPPVVAEYSGYYLLLVIVLVAAAVAAALLLARRRRRRSASPPAVAPRFCNFSGRVGPAVRVGGRVRGPMALQYRAAVVAYVTA